MHSLKLKEQEEEKWAMMNKVKKGNKETRNKKTTKERKQDELRGKSSETKKTVISPECRLSWKG